ncbi:MAG: (2Fe-2S)-binding protein [Burkholderiaceae bacterium]|nr:(2Fe-2S)-binding protein [Burkholderiaceae bacterium]
MSYTLEVNGRRHAVEVDGDTPLLWVLRDVLGMTGTKYGCGMALCGACTVHMDGAVIRACVTPVQAAAGKAITTIEAVHTTETGRAVQEAWLDVDVVQCGYCQPGQIMSATALLMRTPSPSDEQIREGMAGNLCRCGTYPRIHAAVRQASGALRSRKGG